MTTQNNKTTDITINGKTITVPKLQDLPFGIVRKTRNITSDEDRLFTIIELLFSEGSDELNFIDSLTGEEVEQFMTQWAGEGDISVGES